MSRGHKKGGKKTGGSPKKPALTHFLCVPLVNTTSKAQLEDSLARFKDDVCEGIAPPEHNLTCLRGESENVTEAMQGVVEAYSTPANPTTVAEKAVRPAGVLHLTLGVMSLDDTSLATAVSILDSTDISSLLPQPVSVKFDHVSSALSHQDETLPEQVADPLDSLTRPISPPPVSREPVVATVPLSIELKGLVSMHPPHKTSILYTAPSDPSSRLQPLCEALRTRFQDAGLLVEDTRPLKLHATIVNTIYAKGRKHKSTTRGKAVESTPSPSSATKNEEGTGEDRSQGHGPNARAPLRIDARQMLDKYKDFVWAENVVLDRIAICEMGAKKTLNEKGETVNEEYREMATVTLPGSG